MRGVPTAVYIDGFNFYYGAARPHGIRWVDLRRMSQRILGPRHAVEQVYLYTALLHARRGDGASVRNHELLSVLSGWQPRSRSFLVRMSPRCDDFRSRVLAGRRVIS